ncbi:hypothetical protein SLS53_002063 [Cytospora paraplurivora]|uniref:Uncharacterized protein n=1 Tax=Cytospora paraplurivora TaxID=2898453 RepID=A0AAN9UI36_9PEZI
MKRLRKKSLSDGSEREQPFVDVTATPTSPQSPHFSRYSGQSQPSPAPHSFSSLRQSDSLDTTRQRARQNDTQSPVPSTGGSPGPLSEGSRDETLSSQTNFHPIITDIPRGAFLDDLDTLNFSRRGSIYFGGQRATSAANTASTSIPMEKSKDSAARAAVPMLSTDGATESKPSFPTEHQLATPTESTRKLSLPNIRVMSVDTERESQKSLPFLQQKKKAPKRPSFVPLAHNPPIGHFAAVATR